MKDSCCDMGFKPKKHTIVTKISNLPLGGTDYLYKYVHSTFSLPNKVLINKIRQIKFYLVIFYPGNARQE